MVAAAAWVVHGRRRQDPAPPSAVLSTLEEHGERLRDLHGALGEELESWESVEVDIRRRILAADAAVQAHVYGRRRTDTYALRGGRDDRGHGQGQGQGEAPT